MDQIIDAAFVDHPGCVFQKEVTFTGTLEDIDILHNAMRDMARQTALLVARVEIGKIVAPDKVVSETLATHLRDKLRREAGLTKMLLGMMQKEVEKMTEEEAKTEREIHKTEEVAAEAVRLAEAREDRNLV